MNQSTTHPRLWRDRTYEELAREMQGEGVNPGHAAALWKAIYRGEELRLEKREDFVPPLRLWVQKKVAEGFQLNSMRPIEETRSQDGHTCKVALELNDHARIETVIMAYRGRFTACLSTQVGCAMGCVFCATGQMGFSRHLSAGEIVEQVAYIRGLRPPGSTEELRNLVLMGMGEPLHNYDSVMKALEIITDTRGLNIGPGRITISTVGVVPGILRLAEENRPYNLAVSLHGATDEDRKRLVPVAQRWTLEELMKACREYGKRTGRRIFFEWTLIEGVNDSVVQAQQVAELLEGLDAHINLIPLNPTSGFKGEPTQTPSVDQFQRVLKKAGFPCTVRQRRGIDVAAGCGQLAQGREQRPLKS